MEKSSGNNVIKVGGGLILLILLILQGIPIINGIFVSFKDYSFFKGMSGSPFIGMLNFSRLMEDYHFWRILLNTVKLNLLYLVIVLILASLLAFSLVWLNRKMQNIFLSILLIPLFIPGSVLVHLCFTWFRGTMVLASHQWFPFVYAFLLAIKNVGIPTVFIMKTWQITKGHIKKSGFERLMAPLVFILVQFASILNTDMEIMHNLINPLVYNTGDTLGYYIYRMGFMQMHVGTAQAGWVIQLVIHMLFGFAAYVLLSKVLPQKPFFGISGNSGVGINETEGSHDLQTSNPAGFIFPAVFSLFLAWFVFKPLLADGTVSLVNRLTPVSGMFIASYVRYILIYGCIALLGIPISVGLAKSANVPGGFGRLTRIILVFFLLAGGLGMHQYLFYRSLGLFNTVFSLVLHYLFPIANSLVLAVMIAFKTGEEPGGNNNKGQNFSIWKSAFVLAMIQFITMWNSEYVPLVFISTQNGMPPVLLARSVAQGTGGPIDMGAVLGLDFLVTLLPVALFLIFRKLITEWILLSFTKGVNG